MFTDFHAQNFLAGVHGGVHIGNLASTLTAMVMSGIVLRLQTPMNLAGEARNPERPTQGLRALPAFRFQLWHRFSILASRLFTAG
jgi:hypothetical protein